MLTAPAPSMTAVAISRKLISRNTEACRISDFDNETGQPIPRAEAIYGVRASEAEKERLRGLDPRKGHNAAWGDPPNG